MGRVSESVFGNLRETRELKRNKVTWVMLALLITSLVSLTFIVQPAEAEAIVVPVQYSTIQAAVDASKPGDTILVLDGTYCESVNISKSLTIVGESSSGTVIDGHVDIRSDNVEFRRFTIRSGTGATSGVGLDMGSSSGCIITNNIITSCNHGRGFGVWIWNGLNNTISENLISQNEAGIVLSFGASYNKIGNNTISHNLYYGILLETGVSGLSNMETVASADDDYVGNVIVGNDMFGNLWNIAVLSCYSNTEIVGNRLANSGYGVFFARSYIPSDYACNATITGNWVANCREGIRIDADFNHVIGNTVMNCTTFSICVRGSSTNNTVYHNNFINNAKQVNQTGINTVWDDGYPSGGNYWSDYNGTDSNGDGIGDTPYVIDEYNRDNYPLMHPDPFLIGDINCDAEVDIYDVTAVCVAYNSKPGDPNWYPPADIAEPYGIIDIYDVTAVCINYGKKWPN
jgi:parallel beta-helix repeat protein